MHIQSSVNVAIPNRFLFVWTGARFPLFARLAVESTLAVDAEASVELHVFGARPDGAPHFEALTRNQRVAVREVDLDDIFTGLDAPAHAYRALFERIPRQAASARSNLVRYGLLHRYGGIYLDTDIVCIRDFRHLLNHEAFIGEEMVWRADEDRVAGRLGAWMIPPALAYGWAYALRRADARLLGGHRLLEPLAAAVDPVWSCPNLNNAVLGARAGSSFMRRVLAMALEAPPTVRYALGPTLVSHAARGHAGARADVTVLPPPVFYIEPPSYSFRFFEGRPRELPPETVLIHYVASNHRRRLGALDEAELRRQRHRGLFYRLAAQVLDAALSTDRDRPGARPPA